jgi:hypothetical protein
MVTPSGNASSVCGQGKLLELVLCQPKRRFACLHRGTYVHGAINGAHEDPSAEPTVDGAKQATNQLVLRPEGDQRD